MDRREGRVQRVARSAGSEVLPERDPDPLQLPGDAARRVDPCAVASDLAIPDAHGAASEQPVLLAEHVHVAAAERGAYEQFLGDADAVLGAADQGGADNGESGGGSGGQGDLAEVVRAGVTDFRMSNLINGMIEEQRLKQQVSQEKENDAASLKSMKSMKSEKVSVDIETSSIKSMK